MPSRDHSISRAWSWPADPRWEQWMRRARIEPVAEVERWEVICRWCDGPAFLVLGPLPGLLDIVTADRCQHTDGRPFRVEEPTLCDTCRRDYAGVGVKPAHEWRRHQVGLYACECGGEWTTASARQTHACPLASTTEIPDETPFGRQAHQDDVQAVLAAIGAMGQPHHNGQADATESDAPRHV
jgi:hypothetical protein